MSSKKKKVTILIILVVLAAAGAGTFFALKSGVTIPFLGLSEQLSKQPGVDIGKKPVLQPPQQDKDVYVEEDDLAAYYQEQKQKLFALTAEPIIDYWVASSTAIGDTATSSILAASVFYINEKGDILQVKETG
ncbi:MAG: hypothetical protein UV58_C0005G0018 [Candidatus Wolfebacteria bacterium GW2011_GWC1_43_10]|nr:MAG: hypothetical protein UV58_C0005G0018 [Candidatus Wolfebacteria bacterium GW2011_GWC1_43_10]